MRAALASLAVSALFVGGCGSGGDDAPERSVVAEELAALCVAAREDVEALGLPAEAGFAVLEPWAARGRRLARDVAQLQAGTAAERSQLAALAKQLEAYYKGLRLAYDVYVQTKSSESYGVAAERATAYLEDAEALARGLGVSECAERPFADYEPS